MGGQPSRPRKLTIDNEDPSNVIKVSEDVVDRIKGSAGEGPQVRSRKAPAEPNVGSNATVVAPPGQVPTPYFYAPPYQSILQLQQQHEIDLKQNDIYWQERVRNLEQCHRKMREVMEVEFKKAVDETEAHKQMKKHKILPPCQESRDAVLSCYKLHPKEPMLCAKEVQEFAECVDVKRSRYVAE